MPNPCGLAACAGFDWGTVVDVSVGELVGDAPAPGRSAPNALTTRVAVGDVVGEAVSAADVADTAAT